MARVIEGRLDASGLKVAVVAARFNSLIVEQLVLGATDTFLRHGGRDSDLTITRVPGAFELGVTAKRLAETGHFDAVVALGAVIRGATSHYDLVCKEAASGVSRAALDSNIPVLFGVITTDTIEQAMERAGTKAGNKGSDAMMGAIEMAQLFRGIDGISKRAVQGVVAV